MIGKGVLKSLEIVLISLRIFLIIGSASDHPDLLKNQSYNPYQGRIKCQPSDLGSDEVLAVGSCKRVLNTVGSDNSRWIAWWIAFGPSDRTKESYSKSATSLNHRIWVWLNLSHWIMPRSFSRCEPRLGSVDRPTGPPCTGGNIFYFLRYFSFIFALIFT